MLLARLVKEKKKTNANQGQAVTLKRKKKHNTDWKPYKKIPKKKGVGTHRMVRRKKTKGEETHNDRSMNNSIRLAMASIDPVSHYLETGGRTDKNQSTDDDNFIKKVNKHLENGGKLIQEDRRSYEKSLYYHNIQPNSSELSILRSDDPSVGRCRIVNVVASFDVPEIRLNQEMLTNQRPDIPFQYNKRGMKALNLQIGAPPYMGTLKVFIFLTGKAVIEGATNEPHAQQGAIQVCHFFTEKLFPCTMRNFKIHNIVAVGSVRFEIDLEALSRSKGKNVRYPKHNFPAAVIRPPSASEDKKTVVLVFSTGMFVWTGVKDEKTIVKCMKPLEKYLNQFKLSRQRKAQKMASVYAVKGLTHSHANRVFQSLSNTEVDIARPVQNNLLVVSNKEYYDSINLEAEEHKEKQRSLAQLGYNMLLPSEKNNEDISHLPYYKTILQEQSQRSIDNPMLTLDQCITQNKGKLSLPSASTGLVRKKLTSN